MFLRFCQTSLVLLTAFAIVSCGENKSTPAYNPDMGPFDEDGNYIEAWADNPPKRGRRSRKPDPKPEPRVVERSKPKPKPVTTTRVTPKPKPETTARVAPKPKPRPVVKPKPKPKPKPVLVKPKSIRHTVKKGDTLYGLAKKYGTSVSAIKKANGLKTSNIQTGKTYVIPR